MVPLLRMTVWLGIGVFVYAAGNLPVIAAAPVLNAPKPGAAAKSAPGMPAPEAKPGERNDHDDKSKEGVIQTVDLPSLPALASTGKTSWEKGYADIRSAIATLRAQSQQLGLEPKGRPLVVYVESDDQGFRFDLLLPLAKAPAADAKLQPGIRAATNPGGKAMKFEHRGAYAEIENTYQAITALLDEKGLNARDFFIEEFVNDAADANDITMAVNIYVFLK